MAKNGSVEDLKSKIVERYPELSKRLQQVGKFVIDREHEFAIETVATIAQRSGVQPSTIVRFAKEFGFDGASDMQRLFRRTLISTRASKPYRDRVQDMKSKAKDGAPNIPNLLFDFVSGASEALVEQATEEQAQKVYEVAQKAVRANIVYVTGYRRSFPVSSYLGYAFGKAGKHTILIDGTGGLSMEQIQGCSRDDILIAISFSPYAKETRDLIKFAKAQGTTIVLITDSGVSPIAKMADQTLIVRDAEIHGFRLLTAPLCIAQSIIVSFVALTET